MLLQIAETIITSCFVAHRSNFATGRNLYCYWTGSCRSFVRSVKMPHVYETESGESVDRRELFYVSLVLPQFSS